MQDIERSEDTLEIPDFNLAELTALEFVRMLVPKVPLSHERKAALFQEQLIEFFKFCYGPNGVPDESSRHRLVRYSDFLKFCQDSRRKKITSPELKKLITGIKAATHLMSTMRRHESTDLFQNFNWRKLQEAQTEFKSVLKNIGELEKVISKSGPKTEKLPEALINFSANFFIGEIISARKHKRRLTDLPQYESFMADFQDRLQDRDFNLLKQYVCTLISNQIFIFCPKVKISRDFMVKRLKKIIITDYNLIAWKALNNAKQ